MRNPINRSHENNTMGTRLSAVEFFCGAGGMSLGFEWAGFETIAANDINEDPCNTFAENIGVEPVTADIIDLEANDLMRNGGFSPSDVDIIIGGPPCKGFSLAGERDPDDPRNELWREYADFVEVFDPDVIVIENVEGILSMSDGEYKRDILKRLRGLGYNTEFSVLNAANYGVPQSRNRVIFIGTKNGVRVNFPEPTHHSTMPGQQQLGTHSGSVEPYVTVENAISDLCFLGPSESSNAYENSAQTPYQQWARENATELHNHVAPNHGEDVQKRFSLLEQGKGMESLPVEHQTNKQRMVKFDPNQPADTITTLPEDFVHYNRDRVPTVRELARLQSFPDDFVFTGPRTTGGLRRRESVPQYSQVGNAVPPLLAFAIGREVKKAFNKVSVVS